MKIVQAFSFEAAHFLPNVSASHRCRALHGHSYRVELMLEGPIDPHTGFVVDFLAVEQAVEPLRAILDHHCLNDIVGLENPTAENIAVWIYDQVKKELPQLVTIVVHETKDSRAEYGGR